MKYLKTPVIAGVLALAFACSKPTEQKSETTPSPDTLETSNSDRQAEVTGALQGTWVHTEDSTAKVQVSGSKWSFLTDTETTEADNYTIIISNTLPQFVDASVKADYLILGNANDTMHYEITTLTPETLSLIYYPRGNTHEYRRVKI